MYSANRVSAEKRQHPGELQLCRYACVRARVCVCVGGGGQVRVCTYTCMCRCADHHEFLYQSVTTTIFPVFISQVGIVFPTHHFVTALPLATHCVWKSGSLTWTCGTSPTAWPPVPLPWQFDFESIVHMGRISPRQRCSSSATCIKTVPRGKSKLARLGTNLVCVED